MWGVLDERKNNFWDFIGYFVIHNFICNKKWANDPEYRKKQREYNREKYANNPDYRKKELKKRRKYSRERFLLRKEREKLLKELPPQELVKVIQFQIRQGRQELMEEKK